MIADVKSSYEKHDSDSNQRSNWEKHIEIVQTVYGILENIHHLSEEPTKQWQRLQQIKNALLSICDEHEKYGHLSRGFLNSSSLFTKDSEAIFQRVEYVSKEISSIKRYSAGSDSQTLAKALADFESFREKLDADMLKIQTHKKQHSKSKELWRQFVIAFDTARINQTHRTPFEELGRFDLTKEQEHEVSRDYNLHWRIQGTSGSGKTVILIYRALRLAIENPQHTIRIFTINRSLAEHLGKMTEMLHRQKIPSNIRIVAFYDFARDCVSLFRDLDKMRLADKDERFGDPDADNASWREFYTLHSRGNKNNIFARKDVKNLISYIERHKGQTNDACRYLWDEMIYIQSALPTITRQRYEDSEKFKRSSRSIPLDVTQRKICLDILKEWEEVWMPGGNMCSIDGMTTVLANYLLNEENCDSVREMSPADHILLDEFQDFSTLEMMILKKLYGSDETKQNLFFMVGDLNQKVYSKHHHRGLADFNFSGRSTNMRKNYRNTRQILQAASTIPLAYPSKTEDTTSSIKLMGQTLVINSDDNESDILDPELSPYDGSRPIVVHCKQEHHVNTIFQLLIYRYRKNVSIAVVSESEDVLNEIMKKVNNEKIYCYRLERNSDLDRWKEQQMSTQSGSIIFSRLEAVKGFEFNTVIAADMSHGVIPKPGSPEEEKWKEAAIVYAALTRARDELIITYTDRPSEFVEEMRQHVDWESESNVSFMEKLFVQSFEDGKAETEQTETVKTDTEFVSQYQNIWDAARCGTLKDVRHFIERNCVRVDSKRYNDSWTPVFFAARYNHRVEVLEYLISKGADLEEKDFRGRSPSDVANTDIKRSIILTAMRVSQGDSKYQSTQKSIALQTHTSEIGDTAVPEQITTDEFITECGEYGEDISENETATAELDNTCSDGYDGHQDEPIESASPTSVDLGDELPPVPTTPIQNPNGTQGFNESLLVQDVRDRVRSLSRGEVQKMSAEEVLIKLGLWSEIECPSTGSVFDPSRPYEQDEFPEESIRDENHLLRLQEKTKEYFAKAINVKREVISRVERTSQDIKGDRAHIEGRYEKYCQMCEKLYPYWEIAEIFNNPSKELEQMNLSLCPYCATRYRSLRQSTGFEKELKQEIRNAPLDGDLCVRVKGIKLRFTAIHLAEIQTILELQANCSG